MDRLHDGVLERARESPESTAVVGEDETSTYGELVRFSSRIANALEALGFERGGRGAILVPQSPAAVSAAVGVLQADGIVLPLDPSAPARHIAKSVQRASPSVVFFSTETEETAVELRRLLDDGGETSWIRVDDPPEGGARLRAAITRELMLQLPVRPPATKAGPDDPAYLMFTSGSTGTPKGVLVAHRNATHFVEWGIEHFGLSEEDRCSGHAPLHFDLSVFDVFATLGAGGELHPVPAELNTFANRLVDFMRERELTQWFSVPAALKLMARFDIVEPGGLPSLDRILWCGEVLPTPVLRYWMERVPQATFTNLYGPTETTVASSYYTVPELPGDDQAEVPIGRSCPGEELLVLDDDMEPVEAGEVGELYIGGAGVALGYWEDPDRTDEAFVEAPTASGSDGRLYRTGDLGRRDEEGLYHFHGRADRQIKARGHRVELGEIEVALHALPVVEDAAVVAVETDGFEGNRICCAYVGSPGGECEPHEVRQQLSEVLPSYMLPTEWSERSELPRNKNGKVDRPRISRWFAVEGAAERTEAR